MTLRTISRAIIAILVGLLCLLNGGTPALGQDVRLGWQPLGGPGGPVTRLAAADASEMFAVVAAGVSRQDDETQWRDPGVVRIGHALYRSRDGGATWAPLTNDLPPGTLTALHFDRPTGVLYVAVQSAGDLLDRRLGLWRSGDRGAHWEPVALGRDDLNIWRITRTSDGRYLLMGATDAVKYPSSYLLRSADDGRTWETFEVLRYEQRPGSILTDLLAHPTDPARLFITTYGGEVYFSEDAGETWRLPGDAEDAPLQPWTGPARLAIAASAVPGAAAVLLAVRGVGRAAPDGQIFERSRDGGATWSTVPVRGLPANAVVRTISALGGDVFLLGTTAGAYRSSDGGGAWRLLEGPLSAGGVSEFLALPGAAGDVLAATAYGLFASRDGGALWQTLGAGLPANGGVAGLLTDARRPDRILALPSRRISWDIPAPPLLRKIAAGGWAPAAAGLPDMEPTAWALDPGDPDTVYLASWEYFARSSDGGASWQVSALPFGRHAALAVAPSEPRTLYLGGQPALCSRDGGATWTAMPLLPDAERQAYDVSGLVVDAADARRLWAALDGGGVLASADGGATWADAGLGGRAVRWLAAGLYAGVTGDGIYRLDGSAGIWRPASTGLPAGSTILAFLADGRTPGVLWAARDGGGLYRSSDDGASWVNAGGGLGDNLVQALAADYATPGGVLIGTATAGVWALRPNAGPSAAPAAADARVEVVWPHDFAPVSEAQQANLGLRLFRPGSLLPPPCSWTPEVTVWQALNNDPAEPLGRATQRSVDGQPFPFWVLNDVDVSRANNPDNRLYFMVRAAGVNAASSIWAHAADARTFNPQPEAPSGAANGPLSELDARIQIVWPHDAAGAERSVTEAPLVNVSLALFKHGTRLSAPPGWAPAGLTLWGAWNGEIGKPLAREAAVLLRRAGAITYPTWEFNDVHVARSADPAARLYLWATVDDAETYPTIWAHGADARTFFPAKDEPVLGCGP